MPSAALAVQEQPLASRLRGVVAGAEGVRLLGALELPP